MTSDVRVISDAAIAPAASLHTRCLELLTYAKDPRLRIFAIAVAIVVYASELGTFTLSIDEELHAYASQPWRWWIGQGRWAMALLAYLLPPLGTTPFLPTALFCAGLVVSAVLLAGCYARSKAEAAAFIGFFVSSPLWLHVAEFNSMSWGFAFGLSIAAAALVLLHAGGYPAAIAAGIAAAVALGIYQSLILFVVCGSLLSVSLRLHDIPASRSFSPRLAVHYLAPVALSWLIAALLYYAIATLVLLGSNQPLTYVDVYVRLSDFTSAATFPAALARTGRRVGDLLLGTDPTFLGWGLASLFLVWVGAGASVLRTFQIDGGRLSVKLLGAALIMGSVCAGLVPILVSAGTGPLRALSALPLLYATAAGSAMRNDRLARVPHWIIFSFALFVNAWIAATLFNADAIARDRDRLVASQLAIQIADLPGFQPDRRYSLIVVGDRAHEAAGPAARVEIFGTSFFEHDGGNPYRIAGYLRLLGLQGLQPQPLVRARDYISELERLPIWPAPGSVALIREKLVIKLGPLSYAQRRALSN